MHALSHYQRDASPRFQWVRPGGNQNIHLCYIYTIALTHVRPASECKGRPRPQDKLTSRFRGRIQECLSTRLCLIVCPQESWHRRVVLMFHALSGTNLLVTCHSPTTSQIKWYDWNRWFWVDLLSPRLPEKDFKVHKGVRFIGVNRQRLF